MNVQDLNVALATAAVVLLLAVVAVRISVRSGLPSLLLYVGIGVAVGESGIGVRFDNAELTQVLGYSALVLILAEGGISTRWDTVRPAVAPAAVLATIGTSVSVLVTAGAAHWLLNVSWPLALLIGAVVSSTDAAAVFSVLRSVGLPRRLRAVLEAESGFNDAPVVIAVVSLTDVVAGGSPRPVWELLLIAAGELAGGAAIGLAVGWLGALLLRRLALPSAGLYPVTVLALAIGSYAAGALAHCSGFLAVYVAAMVLGNSALPHRTAVHGFAEGVGWLAQIGLFVLLGLLAGPGRLPSVVLPALGVGLALLLVARPLSVGVSLLPFRIPWRHQVFLSWAGLRGAVPIVLATVPAVARIPGSQRLFDLVFVLVIVFTLVQAPTLPWLARWLRIAGSVEASDLNVEVSPLGAIGAEVVQVLIGPSSRLNGVEIFELRLPPQANVTLVVRDGESFVPHARTPLRHGDQLLVVTPSAVRGATERRLRQVSAAGKLAAWLPRGHPVR